VTGAPGLPKNGARAIWVFSVDLPAAEIPAFQHETKTGNGQTNWPLRDALGLKEAVLDPEHIELFEAKTIAEYGLARYLTEANGMSEASVAPDADRLDALSGHVLLVFSRGLPEGFTGLHPRDPVHFVGCYTEEKAQDPGLPLHSETAQGQSYHPPAAPRSKPVSDAAMSGRIATLALLVLFAIAAIMVWVAG